MTSSKLGFIYVGQWIPLSLILWLSIGFNLAGIWDRAGTESILRMLVPFASATKNHLPQIFLTSLPFIAVEGIVSWFMMFVSARISFRKLNAPLKYVLIAIIAFSIAWFCASFTASFLPLIWLPKFGDFLLGLPASKFMIQLLLPVIFPSMAIILLWGLLIPQTKKLD